MAAAGAPSEAEVRMEAGDDLSFKPDVTVGDGDVFKGPGWTMDVIETPGHTSNHSLWAERRANAVFGRSHHGLVDDSYFAAGRRYGRLFQQSGKSTRYVFQRLSQPRPASNRRRHRFVFRPISITAKSAKRLFWRGSRRVIRASLKWFGRFTQMSTRAYIRRHAIRYSVT